MPRIRRTTYRLPVLILVLFSCMLEAHAFREGYAYGIEQKQYIDGFRLWQLDLNSGRMEIVSEEFSRINSICRSCSIINGWIDSHNDLFCAVASYGFQLDKRLLTVDLQSGKIVGYSDSTFHILHGIHFNPVNGLTYAIEHEYRNVPNWSSPYYLIVFNTGDANFTRIPIPEITQSSSPITGNMLDYVTGVYYFRLFSGTQLKIDIHTGKVLSEVNPSIYLSPPTIYNPARGTFFGTANTQLDSKNTHDLIEYDPTSDTYDILTRDVYKNTGQTYNHSVHRVKVDLHTRKILISDFSEYDKIANLNGTERKTTFNKGSAAISSWAIYPSVPPSVQTTQVSGQVVSDTQSNCQLDHGDTPLNSRPLKILPSGHEFYFNSRGRFTAYLPEGTIEMYPVEDELWKNACESNHKHVTIDGPEVIEQLDFLLQPRQLINKLDLSLASSRTIAGRSVTYFIRYHNNGTVPFSGILRFRHDPLLQNFAAVQKADHYENSIASWTLHDLAIGAQGTIKVTLNIPPDENLRGTEICAETWLLNSGSDDLLNNYSRDVSCSEVRAAFDPNDMAVSPQGFGSHGSISADNRELAYTVRFQNVGNAPAYDIVICDTLSPALDVSTLHFGAASHDYSVGVLHGNILEFRFNNIQLPGKEEDEPNSHGVIKYKIALKENVEPNTEIRNQAAIYFDFNRPIFTNTVLNTIGQAVTSVNEGNAENGMDLRSIGPAQFVLHSPKNLDGMVRLYSILGTEVHRQILQDVQQAVFDLESLANGRYIVVIENHGRVSVKTLVVIR